MALQGNGMEKRPFSAFFHVLKSNKYSLRYASELTENWEFDKKQAGFSQMPADI